MLDEKGSMGKQKKKERESDYISLYQTGIENTLKWREREKGSSSVGVASHPLVFHEFLWDLNYFSLFLYVTLFLVILLNVKHGISKRL